MDHKTRYSVEVKLPLEHLTATKLSHMRANEWIGTIDDGRRLYIVSSGNKLSIHIGKDLNEALLLAKHGKGHKITVPIYKGRFIPTEDMLKATGLKLDCTPKEKDLDKATRLPEPKE